MCTTPVCFGTSMCIHITCSGVPHSVLVPLELEGGSTSHNVGPMQPLTLWGPSA